MIAIGKNDSFKQDMRVFRLQSDGTLSRIHTNDNQIPDNWGLKENETFVFWPQDITFKSNIILDFFYYSSLQMILIRQSQRRLSYT